MIPFKTFCLSGVTEAACACLNVPLTTRTKYLSIRRARAVFSREFFSLLHREHAVCY